MVTAIVAAAGRGRRFGAAENKVFAPLAGRTVLHWSIAALQACEAIDAIVVVASAGDVDRAGAIASPFAKLRRVVAGGVERSDSVWNGLAAVPPETELVAVHDGARPLCSPSLVAAAVAAARESGAALPATRVSDTLKRSGDGVLARETVDRSGLFAVQTPQVFRRELLVEAYRSARESGYSGTDDAGYVERLGHPVRLVTGERNNLKITVAEDLWMAEALLGCRPAATRTGFGYDVHRLVPGRALILGGVALEHPDGLGLEGHSDADVVLHAIADAVLGAAALGDIGQHFPNTEERYRGISSLALLREAAGKAASAGWQVVNVDATVMAERPKIAPHAAAMRTAIAEALAIGFEQVSVKATTNERLGFAGREEGIAAYAVATLVGHAPPRALPGGTAAAAL